MARPKPTILMSRIKDKKTYETEEIVAGMGVWAVLCNGKPINIRKNNMARDVILKYKQTLFANEGHANNLLKKLNANFPAGNFEVTKLI